MFLPNWIAVSFTINVKIRKYSARRARATDVETESKIKLLRVVFAKATTRTHKLRSYLSTLSSVHLTTSFISAKRYGGNAAPYTPVYCILLRTNKTRSKIKR